MTVLAHGAGAGAALHLALASLLVLAGAGGLLLLQRSARHARARSAAWLLGLAALAVAFAPRLEDAADRGLTAHMVQHTLLVLAVAPLVAVSRVVPLAATAVRARWRPRLPSPPIAVGTAALLHIAVVAAWHVPALYEAALDDAAVHATEHAAFLVSGYAFWATSVAAGRSGRQTTLAIAAAATTAVSVAGVVLGLALTFSPVPWYPTYAAALAERAMADQQTAGLLMWGAGGPVYLAATAWLVLTMLATADREGRRGAVCDLPPVGMRPAP